ncbi:MAG: DUF1998 domain-containing protein, partial [Acidobacteria bacterium]|nr:DUF1998 domain-containing protein [Acidobacteriota bacterium]
DQRDLGLSVNAGDEDITDTPQIFLYDAYPGGIGFSAPLYGMHSELLVQTRELIAGCGCEHGCPTCVGPVGETGPLAKTVTLRLLDHLTPMALGEPLDRAVGRRTIASEESPHRDAVPALAASEDEVPF